MYNWFLNESPHFCEFLLLQWIFFISVQNFNFFLYSSFLVFFSPCSGPCLVWWMEWFSSSLTFFLSWDRRLLGGTVYLLLGQGWWSHMVLGPCSLWWLSQCEPLYRFQIVLDNIYCSPLLVIMSLGDHMLEMSFAIRKEIRQNHKINLVFSYLLRDNFKR